MAEKAKQIEKKSRIREFIEKDYKYENLLLAVLSIFALELGVLLLAKYLSNVLVNTLGDTLLNSWLTPNIEIPNPIKNIITLV